MEGLTVSDNLTGFHEILAKWIWIHHEAGERWNWDDCIWWYGERASIGALAAAVWKSGGIALEEYTTRKGGETNGFKGRSDLRISHDSKKYTIEAKQIWPGLGNPSDGHSSQISKALNQAHCDLNKSQTNESEQLAVVFASPSLPVSSLSEIPKAVKDWLDIVAKVDADAKAWLFPEQARGLRVVEEGRIYPGTMIVVEMHGRP